MRTDHRSRAKQRHADELRARHDIRYEDALRHAAAKDLSYAAAVGELVRRKVLRGEEPSGEAV